MTDPAIRSEWKVFVGERGGLEDWLNHGWFLESFQAVLAHDMNGMEREEVVIIVAILTRPHLVAPTEEN